MSFLFPFNAKIANIEKINNTDDFFGRIKKKFPSISKSKYYTERLEEAIYFYQIQSSTKSHYGIIAQIPLTAYKNDTIKKHEQTLLYKEKKSLQLLLERQSQIKPVLLTYPTHEAIDNIIKAYTQQNKPLIKIPFMDEVHHYWEITEKEEINRLNRLIISDIPAFYIADGHHRLASALNSDMASVLACVMSEQELEIIAFHRLINLEGLMRSKNLLEKLRSICKIKKIQDIPSKIERNNLILLVDDKSYLLEWKDSVLDKYTRPQEQLHVHVFNEEILKNTLNIDDPRSNRRIEYIEGVQSLDTIQQKLAKTSKKVAFLFPPVPWSDFYNVTDNNSVLPPKSTWFEPRIRNGMICMDIE